MARVFISYKRADKEIVIPLKDTIQAAIGEECWIDLKGIESDDQFAQIIISAIDEAEIVLFMHSAQHSRITNYTTDWTVRELSYAQHEKKRIVFIDIDHSPMTEWFRLMFPQQQLVDISSQEAMTHLIADLKGWLGTNTISESTPDHYTEGFEYTFHRKTHEATIFDTGHANDTHIVIPPIVLEDGEEYKVTKIGFSSLHENLGMQSVVIPDSITEIGSSAFGDCKNLRSIVIPKSITRIKNFTFSGCTNLSSVTLPDTITEIGSSAFSGCLNLEYLTIPNSVKRIGSGAFEGCINLKSIILPEGLTYLGSRAFSDCRHLNSIVLPKGLSSIRPFTFSGCSQLSHVYIPDSIRWLRWAVFTDCKLLKVLTVPKHTFVAWMAVDTGCKIVRR